jgi:hypothetical protein
VLGARGGILGRGRTGGGIAFESGSWGFAFEGLGKGGVGVGEVEKTRNASSSVCEG